ncbi:MAG TPA: hypothetical protein PLO61_05205 [Fimbriimonadaceae bacterium]|nr:hypothetical protein [Fimbriimonadaceae bacterium]HRJ33091.1 hypothetical protein [Fimbriimonadaceae bacterium]
MSKGAPSVRYAEIERETAESRIQVVLDLDGGTRTDVQTGVLSFDRLLGVLSYHGYFDLGVSVEMLKPTHDDHFAVEGVGSALGKAIRVALIDSAELEKTAHTVAMMDEALVSATLDFSGRSHLSYDLHLSRERIGDLAAESVREFFVAMTQSGRFGLHIRTLAGDNNHHLLEACFKAVGVSIHRATRKAERRP